VSVFRPPTSQVLLAAVPGSAVIVGTVASLLWALLKRMARREMSTRNKLGGRG